MTTIFQDTFTGSNGTQLQSHTPDIGTSWTRLYGSAAALDWVINASNQIAPEVSTDNGVIYTADATYSNANYYVEFTLTAQSTSTARPTYALVRVQDQENMYAVLINGGTNTCSLYKKVSGTWTALGSAFSKPADGSVCKLEIIGTTLTFYDDGVSVASATDSSISVAGKAGLAAGGGAELVDSTHDCSNANIWDSFSVVTIDSGQPASKRTGAVEYAAMPVTHGHENVRTFYEIMRGQIWQIMYHTHLCLTQLRRLDLQF